MAKPRKTVRRTARSTSQPPREVSLPKPNSKSVGIACLLFAIVLAFLAFAPGDWLFGVGDSWRTMLGALSVLFALFVAAIGVSLLWRHYDPEYQPPWTEQIGWACLVIFLMFIIHVVGTASDETNLWAGTAGRGFVDFLFSSLSPFGGVAISVVLLALGLILSFRLGLEDLHAVAHTIGKMARVLAVSFGHYISPRPQPRESTVTSHSSTPVRISIETSSTPPARTESSTSISRRDTAPRAGSKPPVPKPTSAPGTWSLPPLETLQPPAGSGQLSETELRQKAKLIEKTLADFDVPVQVLEINPGPTVTQFGLEPGYRERYDRNGELIRRDKIKVSEITSLANDIALALAAPSIRIEAPIPGRAFVGLEVPNATSATVALRGVIETAAFQRIRSKSKLAIGLGQDVSGQAIVADLAKMPHLLIAGATGSGKSVCINSIIASLLLHCTPAELRLLMVDPKRVELTNYNDVPHLLAPVVVETSKAVGVLKLMLGEMDERYKKFQQAGVRDIGRYNQKVAKTQGMQMPYIVVIIDELADLMMVSPDEIEHTLCRLAQMARATGIHLIVATQRPSVNVVTGLIKANIPTRISFSVFSQVDSRTILDQVGAEKLLGRGDMLYLPTEAGKPYRLQGTYVSDDEIETIAQFWKQQGTANYVESFTNADASNEDQPADDLYESAVELAKQHSRISASLLQRRLRIGYSRAARLVDMMEDAGLVGPSEGGGKSREVYLSEVPYKTDAPAEDDQDEEEDATTTHSQTL